MSFLKRSRWKGLISRRGHFFYSSLSIRATDSRSSSRVSHFSISSKIAFKRCSAKLISSCSIPFYLPNFRYSAFQPRIYSAVPGHCRRTYAPTDHANVRPRTSGARKHRNPIMEGAERRRRRSYASEEKKPKIKNPAEPEEDM